LEGVCSVWAGLQTWMVFALSLSPVALDCWLPQAVCMARQQGFGSVPVSYHQGGGSRGQHSVSASHPGRGNEGIAPPFKNEWVGSVAGRGELLLPAVVAIGAARVCVLRTQCCLDDPHLIATAGLRLGSLLKDKQDFLGGVQVVRATLAKVQQYRDAAVAQTVFGAPSSPGAVAGTEAPAGGAGAPGAASGTSDAAITGPSAADQAALSFASATALLPIDTESGLSARAGALAANGAGLFGPGSKVSRESHAATTTCDGLQSTVT
jgi:hypothetical protein